MAGIFGYVGRKQAGPVILDGLRRLEHLGYDTAGLAVGSAKALQVRQARGNLRNLQAAVRLDPIRGTYGVGHTSWVGGQPVLTGPGQPATASPRGIFVALCGKPTNLESLRALVPRGEINEEDPSGAEIVAGLVSSYRADTASLEAAVRQAIRKIEGSCAFAVMARDEKGKIVVTRRGLAVAVGLGRGENFVASDIPAILPRTRDMLQLEDRDIAVLRSGGTRVTNADGRPVFRMVHHVRWDPLMAEKGGYKHFMLKEIFEQPRTIRDTTLGRLDERTGAVVLDELGVTGRELREISHLNLIGCGSSWHASLTAKAMIEHLARVHVEVEYGSEFRYSNPLIDERVLTFVLSQSGETTDTLASQALAHERGSKTIAICNSVDSAIASAARGAIYTKAGPELAALSTKSFTAQLTALYLFAMHLGQVRGTLAPEAWRNRAQDLLELPGLVESALELSPLCEQLARQVSLASRFLFLGRGIQFPIALEGARKLQELAQVQAEGCPAGEIRHGPEALIGADTVVVVIATLDEEHPGSRARYEKAVAQVRDVAHRSGRVICITNVDDERLSAHAQEIILLPSARELLQPVAVLVPLQLLAYHIAVRRGRNIDQPRDIARSVTTD